MSAAETRDRQAHWQKVYAEKAEDEVSWFQPRAGTSLAMIGRARLAPDAAIVDVGGGESRLVDALLEHGFNDVTVLDLSENALEAARLRLGEAAGRVEWIVADATRWEPSRRYDLWHDRAAFHFLTVEADRRAYVARLRRALRPGGHVVIATFAPDGPEMCSGLPVMRHDAASLGAELGPAFDLVESVADEHVTPSGRTQRFQYSLFCHRPDAD